MILYRVFAWNEQAHERAPDGPLWCPRAFQGEGRHDNPHVYGCYYLADRAVSAIVEQLARFRSQRLTPSLLRRRGLPLAVAALELNGAEPLIDLDDPAVLRRERLRPSRVATRDRMITQQQALDLYTRHRSAAGLRWWSVHEALWMHVTLFDRAAGHLSVADFRVLTTADADVLEAAAFLGLRIR